jgi:hypothetical protein
MDYEEEALNCYEIRPEEIVDKYVNIKKNIGKIKRR